MEKFDRENFENIMLPPFSFAQGSYEMLRVNAKGMAECYLERFGGKDRLNLQLDAADASKSVTRNHNSPIRC